MCFQAKVAVLVCLTAACLGLTGCYLLTIAFQIQAKSRGFEADEEAVSWMGKGTGLLLTYT